MKSKIQIEKILPVIEEKLHVKFASLVGSKGEVVRKGITELAIDPKDEMCILAKISSTTPDRSGEVVLPEGIDFTDFKNNGIICWSHNYSELPLGTTEAIEVTSDAVYAKIRFGKTEKCLEVWGLVKDKILKAMSIGFVTLETLEKGTKSFNDFVSKRLSILGDKVGEIERVITKSVLLEVSFVNIGCNQDALVEYISSKGMSAELKRDLGIKEEVEVIESPIVEVIPEAQEAQLVSEAAKEQTKEDILHNEDDINCECETCKSKKEIEKVEDIVESVEETPKVVEETVEPVEPVEQVVEEVKNEEVKQEEIIKESIETPENAGSSQDEAFSNSSPTTSTDIPDVIGYTQELECKPKEIKEIKEVYKSYFTIVEQPKKESIDDIVKKMVEIELKKKRGKISY